MLIKIGKVLKSQGIKGEVKVSCLLDNFDMLKKTKELYISNKPYSIERMRSDGTFLFIKFAQIVDRNSADNLKNFDVYAEKTDIVLPSSRYFIDDLVGCRVVSQTKTYGEIKEILQYGAADVIVCTDGEKEFSFPFLKDLIVSVNIDCKKITIDDKRFSEVCVYED